IAAVYYLLGEEFDRDPFLIFRLRGLERDQLLARLSRSGSATPREEGPACGPLPTDPVAVWAAGPVPEEYGEVEAPPVAAGMVQRLGKFPFWRGERPLIETVEPVYLQASALGLSTFLGERKEKAE